MWLKDLTQLPGLIRDLIALQQESNLLLRELIGLTGRTPGTARPRLASDPPRPKLTANAVTRHGRSDWARIQDQERARTTAPWRTDQAPEPSPTVTPPRSQAPPTQSDPSPRA